MTERWHAPTEQMDEYLGNRLDPPTASSVEAHLMNCSTCRSALAERSDSALLGDSWASIESAIDGEFDSRIERAASRVGVSDREIRTLARRFRCRSRGWRRPWWRSWEQRPSRANGRPGRRPRSHGVPDHRSAGAVRGGGGSAERGIGTRARDRTSDARISAPHRSGASDHGHACSDHRRPDRVGRPAR